MLFRSSHAPGTAVDPNNSANLETTLDGVQGPGTDGMTLTGTSYATDPVKITIQRDKSKYRVEVKGTRASDGAPLSDLTVDDTDDNLYTFWMPSSDVIVNVVFRDIHDEPEGQEVWFHLVGDSSGAHSVTEQTFVAEETQRTNKTGQDNTFIKVKPNEFVYVSAQAEAGYYIKAAYAMFGNAMLPLNLNSDGYDEDGNLVQKDGTFRMQGGRVDVYVEMGDKNDKPDLLHYTAALTVEGPVSDPGSSQGAAGYATLEHTESDPTVKNPFDLRTIKVESNEPFDPVNHTFPVMPEDTLTATVVAKYGYKVSKVVVTPQGLSITPTSQYTNPNTGDTIYTYKMPAANIAVNVVLMRDPDVDFYKATLHLTDPAAAPVNEGSITYDVDVANADLEFIYVPETQTVTVDVTAGVGYYVKHAYVEMGGSVVPLSVLSPTAWTSLQNLGYLETEEVKGQATFVMPAGDEIGRAHV